ncbi:hypothetical protein IK112_02835 [Candidatus Saccharibacteria bacterium]|nr:hypothetical protein [Candidatus Saccharibacteria bacterium]
MNNARQIAILLKQDGYDISNINAAIMALQEDLGYSEEEAVSIANFVVMESKNI